MSSADIPRASAMQRACQPMNVDSLRAPRNGSAVMYGASVSTRSCSAGASSTASRRSALRLKVTLPVNERTYPRSSASRATAIGEEKQCRITVPSKASSSRMRLSSASRLWIISGLPTSFARPMCQCSASICTSSGAQSSIFPIQYSSSPVSPIATTRSSPARVVSAERAASSSWVARVGWMATAAHTRGCRCAASTARRVSSRPSPMVHTPATPAAIARSISAAIDSASRAPHDARCVCASNSGVTYGAGSATGRFFLAMTRKCRRLRRLLSDGSGRGVPPLP